MQVHCRCGQEFTIEAERFPHKVRCHACGHRFNVLADGTTLDGDRPDRTGDVAAPLVAAIQAKPILAVLPSNAASAHLAAGFPDGRLDAEAKAKLKADLRLIDLLWETERDLHALIPWLGISIMPTKTLAVAVGLAFFSGWGVLFAAFLLDHDPGWLCPGTIGAAISVFFPVHIYGKAHGFEKAEAKWQAKRAVAIGKSRLPAASAADGIAD